MNSKWKYAALFVWGLAVGIHGANSLARNELRENVSKLGSELKNCEKNLPRTETCILVAVPKPEAK